VVLLCFISTIVHAGSYEAGGFPVLNTAGQRNGFYKSMPWQWPKHFGCSKRVNA
jgi:hypothetical protein